jgi:hypothetical protein
LFLTGRSVTAECVSFSNSVHFAAANYVQTVAPNGAGTTPGMLGFMFWAAECEGTKTACTTPPNACDGGLGVGSRYFDIPIPLPALRQDNNLTPPTPLTLQSAALLPNQSFAFNVTGAPGANCVVQATTNLTDWTSRQTSAVPFIFTDALATGYPTRFYRAVVLH